LVSPEDLDVIEKDIEIQIKSGVDSFDHIYYHITTKSGDIKYIEDFGHYVVDKEEGPLYYVYLVDSDKKLLTYDVDKVTGLPGVRRLREYSTRIINIMNNSMYTSSYAYIYINLAHFKRFNIRYGIKAGDELLKDLAAILKETFAGAMVARNSDTTFSIFTEAVDIESKLKSLNKSLRNKYGYKDVVIKAGAYVIGKEDITNLDAAFDNASRACHELEYSDDVLYKIYDDEMKKSQHLYNYVINNIDEAISKGWIQAYYQPVIRTLSGTLCSAEALARWIDPKFGILSPASIIGALEDARQIHKLDEYMLNEICKLIRDRISKGLGVVPISFNISRMDFMLMDVYKVITDACKKYEIPHSALKVEITESIVIEDPEGVVEIVNKLRRDGFEIWMDDFGSGYSALGTLKDFNFDEIKVDMQFMKDFSFKSRQIVKHTISMAKSLGIQTLTEGVETQEHYDFLKSIGCEKAQGYLFSKPLPFDDMLQILELKDIPMEASRYSHFYDEISRIDFTENQPMTIINYNKKTDMFEVLFTNDQLKKILGYINFKDNNAIADLLNNPTSSFGKNVRNKLCLAHEAGAETTFFETYRGNYIRFKSRNIASIDDRLMFIVYISNLTTEEQRITEDKLEHTIRHIYTLFDEVYTIDVPQNRMDTIINDTSSINKMKYTGKTFSECVSILDDAEVYQEDKGSLKRYLDANTLVDRIIESNDGYIVKSIRFYDENRTVYWKLIFALLISSREEGKVLVLTRRLTRAEEEGVMYVKKNGLKAPGVISGELIHDSARLFSNIKYFWKDTNRRFLGCSKSFLEYYGFNSQEDIIGKTDEDLNWNVTLSSAKEDDLEVLEKGKVLYAVSAVRIIKGIPHNIACTKWPIYEDGRIVGILGYFVDKEEMENSKDYNKTLVDKDTCVLNSRGFLDGLLKYINESRKLNVPFSVITINIRNMKEIEELQGKDIASKVECAIALELQKGFGVDTLISHIGFGSFAIIRSFLNESKTEQFIGRVVDTIESIKVVDGQPVTLFTDIVAVNSEEAKNSPEGFNKLFADRFNELTRK
nr:EAL domain-containing protein [Acholeplasmatales bacterium]